jgi:integrase
MLRRLVATCDTSVRGRRDRALLLIGFVGALRRSELVGLQVEDVSGGGWAPG